MLRRVINPLLLLPLTLSMNTSNFLSSETKNYIDNVLENDMYRNMYEVL